MWRCVYTRGEGIIAHVFMDKLIVSTWGGPHPAAKHGHCSCERARARIMNPFAFRWLSAFDTLTGGTAAQPRHSATRFLNDADGTREGDSRGEVLQAESSSDQSLLFISVTGALLVDSIANCRRGYVQDTHASCALDDSSSLAMGSRTSLGVP